MLKSILIHRQVNNVAINGDVTEERAVDTVIASYLHVGLCGADKSADSAAAVSFLCFHGGLLVV